MMRKHVVTLLALLVLISTVLYMDQSGTVRPAQAASDNTHAFQGDVDMGVIRSDHRSELSGNYQDGSSPAMSAPNQPVLVSPANGSTQVSVEPNLRVTVSDPDANNLTVTFYGRRATVANPAENFTIIAMPDTQHYTDDSNNYAIFSAQTRWIVNNRISRNIVFVTGLGDIVEHGDNNGNNTEWQIASAAYSLIENPATTSLSNGIPYGLSVGNHDQSPAGGGNTASTTFYNQFFGVSRFSGRGYYGGHYGSKNNNHFELFSAGGMNFIIIHLEYDTSPEQAVLNWASNLLTTHSNRRAIVSTHYMVTSGNPASFGSQGKAIYNALKGHANLFLMLGGHICGEGRRQDPTVNGKIVYSLLSNYQCLSNGGDGWLRIMTFSPANNVIRVQTFSPTRNGGNGDFQTDNNSQFNLSYEMQGKPPFQVIGTRTGVPSGSTIGINWPNREFGTKYEWYVTVNDGTSVRSGPVWSFTTTTGKKTFLPLVKK